MDNILMGKEEARPQRRRRSHQKTSKAKERQRQHIKDMLMWLMYALIGAGVVAAIAVLAGRAGS